jgi:glycosyltransferase involved in cell wall biosynthesis
VLPRILMLSDRARIGGAAVAAGWLADGLSSSGAEVVRVVAQQDDQRNPTGSLRFSPPIGGPVSLKLALWRTLPAGARRSLRRFAARKFVELLDRLGPDLVNVHNLHNGEWAGWSVEMIQAAQERVPTVWTLHDMWSFTGRCAYSFDCDRYLSGCNHLCPTADEYPRLGRAEIAAAWRSRVELLGSASNLVGVAPSRWLAERARAAGWQGRRIEVIPYGVPTGSLFPVERQQARRELGLSPDGLYLLFAGVALNERRKGGEMLRQALERLGSRRVELLTMGRPSPAMLSGLPHTSLGFISSEAEKRLVYSAADVLLFPSLSDNLPLTVLEAIACGTPVIAFRTGGVGEAVRPGISGWIVDQLTADALARRLELVLDEISSGIDLRENCRRLALDEYDSGLTAAAYRRLFDELIVESTSTNKASRRGVSPWQLSSNRER